MQKYRTECSLLPRRLHCYEQLSCLLSEFQPSEERHNYSSQFRLRTFCSARYVLIDLMISPLNFCYLKHNIHGLLDDTNAVGGLAMSSNE